MWALVGSYAGENEGGITVFRDDLTVAGQGGKPLQAGYMVYGDGRVYCVDERKTDGRGPVGPAASIHAFGFDRATGVLDWQKDAPAFGPFPTFLDYRDGWLTCASHGSFDHVQQVVRTATGWTTEFVYDHSTVAVYDADLAITDVVVLKGHGMDPNSSPQAGGHAQSSAHAHCATIDPSGKWVVVCDKGTDRVVTYRLGMPLECVADYHFPPETAPRHVAFSADGRTMFVTLELASGLARMSFDPDTGHCDLIARVAAANVVGRVNEPAEVRLHPYGHTVYINNRGEDALVWFDTQTLERRGSVALAPSIHPGLAARSFAITPDGKWLYLADRPADLLRVYAIADDGSLTEHKTAPVSQPAFVLLIDA